MSLIGEILPLSHIVLDMEVGSKKRLFEEAACFWNANPHCPMLMFSNVFLPVKNSVRPVWGRVSPSPTAATRA